MEFLNGLDPFLQVLWYIAIPVSLVFVIQSIMTFIGMDATDGLEADFDGSFDGGEAPFQLFSFRNLINFLLGFSWAGITFFSIISNQFLLITFSVLIGALFVAVFFIIIKQLQKLVENNSFNINNTIGKTADVYLAIPERKTGKGKVQLSVKGAFHELEAITENERIETGAVVKIVSVEGSNLVIVEKIS
jgi:membrane-bound ClpP family serine protease